MAQYARPDSDVAAGSWTYSTGSTLYGCIDESSYDDADEIRINNATGTCQIGLSNVTDPSSSGGHVIRYRAMKSLAQPTLTVYLYQGATLIASHTPSLANGTYNTFTYTLTSGEADSITDYTDLRLHFAGNASGGGGRYARVSWAEFEVPNASTSYDDSVSLARTASVAEGHDVTLSEATSLARSAGMADGNDVTLSEAASLARSAGIGESGILMLEGMTSVSREAGLGHTAELTISETASLAREAGIGEDSALTLEGATDLAREAGVSDENVMTLEEAASLARTAGIEEGGGLVFDDTVTLTRLGRIGR